MAEPKIAVIVPSYSVFDYARRTLLSLAKYTPNAVAIVVDDASPDWDDGWYRDIDIEVDVHRFDYNGGLTRSWNHGFEMARKHDPDYIVSGNNDILFTAGWYRGLIGSLRNGLALAGPLSNAPGETSAGRQGIKTYVPNYVLTDTAKYNNQLAAMIWKEYGSKIVCTKVNGFFMMAEASVWYGNAYDERNVFCPVNTHMPSGRKNITPLMTGNEDELQARWGKSGLKFGAALGSFIFHYRSVARGSKYVKGSWVRMTDAGKEV